MHAPGTLHSDLTAQLPGYWENETTKDTWHFKPQKNKGYTAMEIIQSNSGLRVIYAYKILPENKIIYIDIDNTYFQVIEIIVEENVTMKIKNPAGNIITLHKKRSQ